MIHGSIDWGVSLSLRTFQLFHKDDVYTPVPMFHICCCGNTMAVLNYVSAIFFSIIGFLFLFASGGKLLCAFLSFPQVKVRSDNALNCHCFPDRTQADKWKTAQPCPFSVSSSNQEPGTTVPSGVHWRNYTSWSAARSWRKNLRRRYVNVMSSIWSSKALKT